ncbi:MAG: hypothetical protein HRU11_01465 [Parvularculaceae bacterium]|nr:hypothetical protein [Parvularculaceae bacterium]
MVFKASRWAALLVGGILASCGGGELPVVITAPSLEGAMTEGRWEQRGRDGLTFWPPSREGTRLPELIDFACIEGSRTEFRLTVTGDTDRTGLWMAEGNRSGRKAILVTDEGATELEFQAGLERLPSLAVSMDEDWLKPLLEGEGTFAINAFGTRTYRVELTPLIKKTLQTCRKTAGRR